MGCPTQAPPGEKPGLHFGDAGQEDHAGPGQEPGDRGLVRPARRGRIRGGTGIRSPLQEVEDQQEEEDVPDEGLDLSQAAPRILRRHSRDCESDHKHEKGPIEGRSQPGRASAPRFDQPEKGPPGERRDDQRLIGQGVLSSDRLQK